MSTEVLSNPACNGPCGGANERRPGQRWCRPCHAAWMRENRPRYALLSERERLKQNCRARTHYLIRTGQLVPKPCRVHRNGGCVGAIVPHHRDYTNPWDVDWLCKGAHQALHNELRRAPALPFDDMQPSVGAVAS